MVLRLLLPAVLLLVACPIWAGDYENVLSGIENNSITLAAARRSAESSRADLHTQNTLEGPEAGFDYLWGNKNVPDNRINFSLSQSIDFPVLYHRRRSLINSEERNVDLRYSVLRREVLSQARSKCISVIYCNRMLKFFNRHLDHTQALATAYHNLMEQGQATVLESGKAALAVAKVSTEKRRIEIERASLMSSLQAMNGGNAVELNDTLYPEFVLPADADKYCELALENSPELALALGEANSAHRKSSVESAEALPKLSVGYTGEKQGSDLLQGVSVGVAIPLWSNRSKVRAARAAAASAQLQATDIRTEAEYRLRDVYNTAVTNKRIVADFERAIADTGYGYWLAKALELRNISVTDYIQELGVLCTAIESLEEAKRDAAGADAEAASYLEPFSF